MVSNDAGALESKPFFDEPKLRHLKLSSSRTELRIELFWHMRCSALLCISKSAINPFGWSRHRHLGQRILPAS
jgi:hypothetical protein